MARKVRVIKSIYCSRVTGVNYGRITRIEFGEPVKEAKLIRQVYKLTLEKVEILEILRAMDRDRVLKRTGIISSLYSLN